MSEGGTEQMGRRVSINSRDVLDIQPIVYSFKVPSNSKTSGSVLTAPRPPQWLYHDHVMGVIWMIFHKEKNYVGISQLQWCLRFLLDLKNSQGEYTGDVEICIRAIEDNLIEQYAKLGPALEKTINKKKLNDKDKEEDLKSELVGENNSSKWSLKANVTDTTNNNNNNNEGEDKDLTGPKIEGILGTSTPQEEEFEAWKYEKKQIMKLKKSDKHCGNKCGSADENKKDEEMLSFTYNEMISRGSAPCKEPYLIEDHYSDQQLVEPVEVQQVNVENLNSSELVNFLNVTKQQKMENINKEMETLRILEQLLENFNTSGISPDNIEDLKKSLVNLQNQEVTNETEEIQ